MMSNVITFDKLRRAFQPPSEMTLLPPCSTRAWVLVATGMYFQFRTYLVGIFTERAYFVVLFYDRPPQINISSSLIETHAQVLSKSCSRSIQTVVSFRSMS